MRRLAEWIATQDFSPTNSVIHQMARELSGYDLPAEWIPMVMGREDWQVYRDQVAADDQLRARRTFEHNYQAYVTTHRWALEAAAAVGDYKTAAEIAAPVLDRVAPKRDQHIGTSQTVIIKLGHTSPLVQTEPIEVEVLPVNEVEQ